MSYAAQAREERAKAAESDKAVSKFTVWVFTGATVPAGDTAVSITVVGSLGTKGPFVVGDKAKTWGADSMDKFMVDMPDVGVLKKIKVSTDTGAEFFVKQVVIKKVSSNSVWQFPCGMVITAPKLLSCGTAWEEDEAGKPKLTPGYSMGPNGMTTGDPPFDAKNKGMDPGAEPYSLDIDYVKIAKAAGSSVAPHAEDEAWELMDNAFIQYKRLMDVQTDITKLLDEATSRVKLEVAEESRLQLVSDIKAGKAPVELAGMTEYTIKAFTGFADGAATDASSIFVDIAGSDGITGKVEMSAEGTIKGQTSEHKVKGLDVGTIKHVTVGHSGLGSDPGWFLEKLIITPKSTGVSYSFPCYRWIAADKEDGCLQVGLMPDSSWTGSPPADALAQDPDMKKTWAIQDALLNKYSIRMITSKSGGKTSGPAFVTLVSDAGVSSGKRKLSNASGTGIEAGTSAEFEISAIQLGNLSQLLVSHSGSESWELSDAAVVDKATNNMWIFNCGKALSTDKEVELSTDNSYLYFGSPEEMAAYASERDQAIAKIQAHYTGNKARSSMGDVKGRKDQMESDIDLLATDPASLKRMLLRINEEMGKAEEEQVKLKETNAKLAAQLAELEAQRAKEREALQSDLDAAQKQLEEALEKSKVPAAPAEKKKSGFCEIL